MTCRQTAVQNVLNILRHSDSVTDSDVQHVFDAIVQLSNDSGTICCYCSCCLGYVHIDTSVSVSPGFRLRFVTSLFITDRQPHPTVYRRDRAFPVAAARVWNSLPEHVTSAPSVAAVFRSSLKTHLFHISYPMTSRYSTSSARTPHYM